jgi:hypothetical protein
MKGTSERLLEDINKAVETQGIDLADRLEDLQRSLEDEAKKTRNIIAEATIHVVAATQNVDPVRLASLKAQLRRLV